MSAHLEFIAIGGLGEFGMNCAALRFGDDMILIDAGMAFPRRDQGTELGVNVIVPDIAFFKENKDRILGIFLTHGHEDHIGSVPYIIDQTPLPVYGSSLTLALVKGKLEERSLPAKPALHELRAREKVQAGPFEIEPLHVTHSFPDSFAFAIRTPVGVIVWSGDFKFDQAPVDQKLSDIHRLAAYGEEGVLALFSDSTNSTVPGLAPSERSVYEPLRNLFRKAQSKIIATTFSSSISRIQILLDLALEFDRFVLPVGRSIVNNFRIASERGYLKTPADRVINVGDVKNHSPERILILATGSQGEPMAALSRLSIDQFRNLRIEEGDMVIHSARIIPGNEKAISNMVNHIYRRGARVYDANHSAVHASGHGFADDLKLMINLIRPRFFIPIHGEYRNLKTHCWLAEAQGFSEDRVLLVENGDVLHLRPEKAEITDKVSLGRRFIDEGVLEEVHELVLRERRFLSEDGFLVVMLRMDRSTGDLIGEPELVSRGFVLMEESENLIDALKEEVVQIVQSTAIEIKQDQDVLGDVLRKGLQKIIRRKTGKRPIIIPVTIEI